MAGWGMKTVSAKVPEEKAERFDRVILAMQLQGAEISKSAVLRCCIDEFIEENEEVLEQIGG